MLFPLVSIFLLFGGIWFPLPAASSLITATTSARDLFNANTPCHVHPMNQAKKSVMKPCINVTEYENVEGYEYEAVNVGVCLRFSVDGGRMNPTLPKGKKASDFKGQFWCATVPNYNPSKGGLNWGICNPGNLPSLCFPPATSSPTTKQPHSRKPTIAPVIATTPTSSPINPTSAPTSSPIVITNQPTSSPIMKTSEPSPAPIIITSEPTSSPVIRTLIPTSSPEVLSLAPTKSPISQITHSPHAQRKKNPRHRPTRAPHPTIARPSRAPIPPTLFPTRRPTRLPTIFPTRRPTTLYPSNSPTPPTTYRPTTSPTKYPSKSPTPPTTFTPTTSPTLPTPSPTQGVHHHHSRLWKVIHRRRERRQHRHD